MYIVILFLCIAIYLRLIFRRACAPDFGHQLCGGVAFGANVLHHGRGLLRRAALGQRFAQEGERDCGRLFCVECEPEGAVLDSDGGVRQIIVSHVRQDAGFHVVAGLAQLAQLIVRLFDLVVQLHPALNALF
jgi:hypothetical protein